MSRVIHLTVPDWDSPAAKESGVRQVKRPFAPDLVEAYVDWLRSNNQWRYAPSLLVERTSKFLSALNQQGPLADPPITVQTTTVPAASTTPNVERKVPCPHCDRHFALPMHLARHITSKHPDTVTSEPVDEAVA